MSYKVVAPLVLAKDREGKTHHRYTDEVIEWLPPDQAAHFVDTGLVVKVGAQSPVPDASGGDGAPEKPKQVAPKADWVDYAVSEGLDRDEAEAMTKAELIEQYG